MKYPIHLICIYFILTKADLVKLSEESSPPGWVFMNFIVVEKNENLMKSSQLVFAFISDNWIKLPWDFWSQTEFWFFSCHLILQLNMSTHEPPAVIRIRHKSNQSSSLRLWVWGILSWDAGVSKFHGTPFCLTSVTQIISSYSNLKSEPLQKLILYSKLWNKHFSTCFHGSIRFYWFYSSLPCPWESAFK